MDEDPYVGPERRARPTIYAGPDRRRAPDPSIEDLSQERQDEIARLAHRVEQLMAERQGLQHGAGISLEHFLRLENNQGELSRQVARLEFAIFGAAGETGLSGSVRALQTSLDRMRDEEFKSMKESIVGLKASIRLWILGLLPVILAAAGLIIALHG